MADTSKTEKVREICKKLKPVIGERADQLWLAYSIEDEDEKKDIEHIVNILAARILQGNLNDDKAILVPPTKDKAAGAYYIGEVCYDDKTLYPFGLRESELIQHVAYFGRSGAGKTLAACTLLWNLIKQGKPFLIFDWKRNYRDVLTLPGTENILVFTVGRSIAPFTFNPLIPPKGTDAKTWLKKLIEIIAHAYLLGNGVMYLLQQAIDNVYNEFGIYEGKVEKWPTFQDVLNWLKNYPAKGREANWMSSTLRAISTLCFGEMDKTVNTKENQGLEKLLESQVILELDALTQSDKTFVIEALILWIHHYRMAQSKREEFKHALIIEEAHHILCGSRRTLFGGETIMETIFREVRELGEAIIFIDQHPSMISLPALGNTYCTIAMNLKHSKDVNTAAACMLLSSEEKQYLGSLEIGYAIVKLQGRIQGSFLIKIPEFEIKKGSVSDRQIAQRIERAKCFSSSTSLVSQSDTDKVYQIETIVTLSEQEKRFVRDVLLFPKSGTVQRYKRLGLSARQGNKIKDLLITKGLIRHEEVLSQTGRRKLIRLSEKGRKWLNGSDR